LREKLGEKNLHKGKQDWRNPDELSPPGVVFFIQGGGKGENKEGVQVLGGGEMSKAPGEQRDKVQWSPSKKGEGTRGCHITKVAKKKKAPRKICGKKPS